MNKSNLFPVAKEGWNYIGYGVLLFIVLSILDLEFLGLFCFVGILFLIYIYRNPERLTSFYQQKSIVSPVDGKIISIEEIDDKEYAYKIEIQSGYFDVSILRVPFKATLKSFELLRGAKLSFSDNLAKKVNERATIVLEDESKNSVKIEHIVKKSFDKLHVDAKLSQEYSQGSRYGVMLTGITTIYLPRNVRINVSPNNEVLGSESLLAYFS